MKHVLKLLPLALLFLICVNLSAQNKVINVWKGKVPGSVENNSYKEKIILTEKGSERIEKVSVPTLTVYAPDKEKTNGTAVVICPGGGYTRLAISRKGTYIAEWFNRMGVTAFVLKYRLPGDEIMKDKSIGPLQDVQEAIRIVRRRATEWGIDPAKIGVMGFSAGGHLASTAATHFNDKVYENDGISARPDFSILIYPVISMKENITHAGSRKNLLGNNPGEKLIERFSNELRVNGNTPPAFLVHSGDDKTVPVENSINYFLSLKKYNIPAELHIYEKGGHGYGLAEEGDTESSWPGSCVKWMKVRGLL